MFAYHKKAAFFLVEFVKSKKLQSGKLFLLLPCCLC